LERYDNKSIFLAALNNEKNHTKYQTNYVGFTNLHGIMLVEFTNDTMIHPKETAIFGSDDGKGNLINMRD